MIGPGQILERTIGLVASQGARVRALGARISPRDRRWGMGTGGALLAHGLMLWALVGLPAARQVGSGPSDEIGGQVNAFNGMALSPFLVSLAPRGDLGASPVDLPAARSQARAEGARAPDARRSAEEALETIAGQEAGDEGEANTASKDLQAAQADPAAAAAVQGAKPEAALQGGVVEGEQNLLRQIARCLPVDQRPVVEGASLAIRLDASGGLAAAPAMDLSLALASPDAIADANRIVQAALQCGPYGSPGGAGADYVLKADFSFLKPQQVAADVREPASHGR